MTTQRYVDGDRLYAEDFNFYLSMLDMVVSELPNKSDVGHRHEMSDIDGFESVISDIIKGKMDSDGSNYVGSLNLVSPSISSIWTIKKQDGTSVSEKTENTINVENGAVVDYRGTFRYPSPNANEKIPSRCEGSFGSELPQPNNESVELNMGGIDNNKVFSVSLYAPKSGLEVQNNKVVKAEGEETTSTSAKVSFYHLRYYGVSREASVDIKTLKSELSNSRAKTVTFDCSGGKYFYYAYPKTLGKAAWNVGGLAIGMTPTEITITNEYGLSVAYYVYRSENLQTGSSIKAIIS